MKILFLTFFFSLSSFAYICGEDDRIPHFDMKIGRMKLNHQNSGCTATMISKNCALSAGHCLKHMKTLEFNVPLSHRGKAQFADPHNIYVVDESTIVAKEVRPSTDWAVFKVKKNMMTGKSAGEVNGFYPVSFDVPEVGEIVRISGYGVDSRGDKAHNFTLQTDYGPITAIKSLIFNNALHYRIDGTGGTSGSAVLRVNTNEIIGIHTHGGCDSIDNHGTIISKHPELMEAIKACIESDK